MKKKVSVPRKKPAKSKIKVKVLDGAFVPDESNSVFAYFSDFSASVQIPYRNIQHISLGFGLNDDDKYSLEFEATVDLMSKGILILGLYLDADNYYKVVLGNVGKEIVVIKHGDRIGTVRVLVKENLEFTK